MRMGNTLLHTAGTPSKLMRRTYRLIRTSITTTAGFNTRFVRKTSTSGTVSDENP
jgi:hypothetical protein